MKAICACGFEFFAEFVRGVCPKCGQVVEMIRAVAVPAIVSRFYVMPSLCGDPDKVWMQHEAGEAGDFSRLEFVEALAAGMATGQVDDMLERFFWENF